MRDRRGWGQESICRWRGALLAEYYRNEPRTSQPIVEKVVETLNLKARRPEL